MKQILKMAAAALVASAVGASAAPVATLEILVGEALLERGGGLQVAETGAVLQPGQRIVLRSGGAALLTSAASGCTFSLREAGEFTVPDLSSCSGGAVIHPSFNIAPANGGVVVVGAPASGMTGVVVGLTVAGIAAGTLAWSASQGDDAPVPVSAP